MKKDVLHVMFHERIITAVSLCATSMANVCDRHHVAFSVVGRGVTNGPIIFYRARLFRHAQCQPVCASCSHNKSLCLFDSGKAPKGVPIV